MRMKSTGKIRTMKNKFEEVCPECSYFSVTTTYQGNKGRFLGYDLGDNLRVGVFTKSNTNTCKIITKGDQVGKEELVKSCIDILSAEGFPIE